MAFKDLWATPATVEMSAISGAVRVEIQSNPALLAVILEIAGFAWFSWFELRSWKGLGLVGRVGTASLFVSGALGLAYFLTRSELIEFDQQNLTIHRNILGWDYVSSYPIENLTELTWCVQEGKSKFALECKYGWRKIRFARNASEDQAREILALLQNALPEVAQKMGTMPGGSREQITRLRLS
jgi:hypothetical protein